jgi:hypothetical protein
MSQTLDLQGLCRVSRSARRSLTLRSPCSTAPRPGGCSRCSVTAPDPPGTTGASRDGEADAASSNVVAECRPVPVTFRSVMKAGPSVLRQPAALSCGIFIPYMGLPELAQVDKKCT